MNYMTWDINPVLLSLGPLKVHWYGLLFALSFIIGFQIMQWIFKREHQNIEDLDKLLWFLLIGVIIGARLAHVIFYEPTYYFSNPISILKIWEGGLASHGGAIGIIIAAYILSKKVTKKSILWIVDRIAVPTSFAGGLIRLGNLFNSEIVGKETTSSIGFKFIRHDIPVNWAVEQTGKSSVNDAYDAIVNNPAFADVLASVPVRYPTQLIEALAYFIIFILMMLLYWKTNAKDLLGFLVGTFFVTIFGARFFIEYLKIEQGGTDSNLGMFNMGQYLSIPLVLIGLYLILRHIKSLKVNKNA